MIVVEIKPSRLRVIVLMALHLAAASSFVFGLELGLAGSVVLAVLAWSLSVVDVAIVLGPGNPPTLAVLAWQWLSQGDAQQQAKGMLLCLLLLVLLAALASLVFGAVLGPEAPLVAIGTVILPHLSRRHAATDAE